MNKDFKVIQIHGLSGLLLLGFILTGVFCGFVLFPIWVLMQGWNAVAAEIFHCPGINYIQAFLLWAFLTLSIVMALKNSISIKIQKDEVPTEIDITNIISETREAEEQESVNGGN